MFRPLRKLLLALGTLFVLLLTGLAPIGHFYEDEVKARLLGALNAHLNGPVEWARSSSPHPALSTGLLHLHDVLAREALPDQVFPDTLLHAEDLYLEFGLLDLFRGDYVVRGCMAPMYACMRPATRKAGRTGCSGGATPPAAVAGWTWHGSACRTSPYATATPATRWRSSPTAMNWRSGDDSPTRSMNSPWRVTCT